MTQTILNQLREEAKQSFKELDYPSLNYGSGIRLEQDFKDITESEESSLKILAPSEVKVLNIKDTNIAEKYLAKLIKVNQNKFTALHYKLLNNVKFIIIPENATLNDTICIESISNSNLSEHLVVIAKANSKANIIIKKKNSSPFASQFIEAYTEANAELSFYNIGKHKEDTINIVYHKGEALQDSTITWTDIMLGSKFTQLWTETRLLEQGAKTRKHTAFFSSENQQFDINDVTEHKASHTESLTYSRGAVTDFSKTIYRGNIKVNKNAKNCTGHQKADNILLSEDARCDAVPILEINNDDISCSHGATFSKLNNEHLFYLTSRGLDNNLAKQTLILGFFEKILADIPDENIKDCLSKTIKQKLNKEVSHVTN